MSRDQALKQSWENLTFKFGSGVVMEQSHEFGFNAGWDACNTHTDSKETASADSIKIEVGKRYVMRDGEVTGVVVSDRNRDYPFKACGICWSEDGRFNLNLENHSKDIVSEYIELQPEEPAFKAPQDIFRYLDVKNNRIIGLIVPDIVGYKDGYLFNYRKGIPYKDVFSIPENWKPYHEPKDWRDTVSSENPAFCWLDKDHSYAGWVFKTEKKPENHYYYYLVCSVAHSSTFAEPVATGQDYETLIKILKGGE